MASLGAYIGPPAVRLLTGKLNHGGSSQKADDWDPSGASAERACCSAWEGERAGSALGNLDSAACAQVERLDSGLRREILILRSCLPPAR